MSRTSVPDATRREIAAALLGEARPSDNALAERYGVPRQLISRIRSAIGVPATPIAERMRRMQLASVEVLRSRSRPPETIAAIRLAYRRARSLSKVAAEVGVSHETVRKYVRDLIDERRAAMKAAAAIREQARAARRSVVRELTDAEKVEIRRLRADERMALKAIAARYPGVPPGRITELVADIRPSPMASASEQPQRLRAVRIPMRTRRAVVRDRDAGMQYTQIAVKYGISRGMAAIIVKRRDLIPPAEAIGPAGRRRVNRPAVRLTPALHAAITMLWLDGLNAAEIADQLHAPRATVKAFAQKLKARGGWYSSVYDRTCLRCRQPFAAQKKHARFHRTCVWALDGRRRRALREREEAERRAIG